MTLIEALIGIGLVSILSLILAQVLVTSRKGQRTLDDKYQIMDLTNSVQAAFKQSNNTCSCFFKKNFASNPNSLFVNAPATGINMGETPTLSFYSDAGCSDANKKNILDSGQVLEAPGLQVKSLTLSKPFSIGGGIYLVDVTLSVQSKAQNSMAFQPIKVQNIMLTYNGGVMACSSQAESLKNVGCTPPNVLTGFNSSGQPICVDGRQTLSSMNCPTGQVLKGFSSSGQPNCVPTTSLAGVDCGAGQALKGFSPTGGAPICISVADQTETQLPPPADPAKPAAYQVYSMECSAPDMTIINVYLAAGRCADFSGLSYWGERVQEAKTHGWDTQPILDQIKALLQSETQTDRDKYCQAGYSFTSPNICTLQP